MPGDIRGRVVSEAEAATDLGFADVHEFRRWRTEMGLKLHEAEHALKSAIGDRDRFRSVGLEMQAVLERIAPVLKGSDHPDAAFLILAIGVATGKEADWGGKVRKWLVSGGVKADE